MSELRTLLSIFQTESDDAEIQGRGEVEWHTVRSAKTVNHNWAMLNDPIWTVKRKPRVFKLIWNNLKFCFEPSEAKLPVLKHGETIKVVEVIE